MAADDLTLQSQSLGAPTENLPEACPLANWLVQQCPSFFSWGLCWVSHYTISTEHFEWGQRLNNTSTTPNSDATAVSENQRKEEKYNQPECNTALGFWISSRLRNSSFSEMMLLKACEDSQSPGTVYLVGLCLSAFQANMAFLPSGLYNSQYLSSDTFCFMTRFISQIKKWPGRSHILFTTTSFYCGTAHRSQASLELLPDTASTFLVKTTICGSHHRILSLK